MVVISQLGLEQKRRQKLADALKGQADNQPVASHLQGLAKVLAAGVGGYQQSKADALGKQYEEERNKALQKALNPSVSREDKMAGLVNIPEYQDVVVKASLEKPEALDIKAMAEAAVLKASQGQPLTQEDQAAVSAYNQLKGMEQVPDPAGSGSMMQKFRPLSLGGTPQQPQSAPRALPPVASPNVSEGLLPPPSGTGTPQASLFPNAGNTQPQPTLTPPAGLSPKSQQAFQQAVATAEAEKLINGGAPKLTERQGKATGFAARMEQAAGEIQNLLSADPSYNQSNIIDNLAGTFLPSQVRNVAMSETGQTIRAAQENWIAGLLRLDSGAAIPPAELEAYRAQYFPVAGDNEATIAQKERARAAAIEAVKAEAGAGYQYTSGQLEAQGLGKGLPQAKQLKPQTSAGGLTPEEQAEYEQLKKMFGE